MASTARAEKDKKEFFDSPEELERKVQQLAEWVRESRHFFVFTGAGISTSAGIPDFRSGLNTVLETGPGAWELRAKGQQRDSRKHKTTTTLKAIPTQTHMALVQLQKEGLLKCVVSQNCDGLHRRSGLPKNALFELHGNSNVEKCTKCGHEYLRDFGVRTSQRVHSHLTGRQCDDPKCRGKLKDTIINFGENLPEDTLETSFDHGSKADLCMALGSSLTVTPAADIPETVGERGQRLVVVNLQRTPLDHLCALRIYAKTDQVSRMLMEKLGLEIPEFRLHRGVVIKMTSKPAGQVEVSVSGADQLGYPFSFLKKVTVTSGGRKTECCEEPFVASVPRPSQEGGAGKEGCVVIEVEFHAHYGEPPITLPVNVDQALEMVDISFNPFLGQWDIERGNGGEGGEGVEGGQGEEN
jgi:NAD-dependent SIR2 family protein deacetylase